MALVNGNPADLHKLDKDVFVLMDGTIVSPLHITLDGSEMDAMLASRQAGILVEKYEPVEHKDKSVSFKLRSNHSRALFKRQRREAMRKTEHGNS